jgi:hypothetical protein
MAIFYLSALILVGTKKYLEPVPIVTIFIVPVPVQDIPHSNKRLREIL